VLMNLRDWDFFNGQEIGRAGTESLGNGQASGN
jgi:hypothetical protein